jgi:hypothetical protein
MLENGLTFVNQYRARAVMLLHCTIDAKGFAPKGGARRMDGADTGRQLAQIGRKP